MQRSQSILSDGHLYNSPRRLDRTHSGTLNAKVKHSSNPNESKDIFINTSEHDNNESTSASASDPSMEETPDDSGPTSNPRDTLLVSVDSLIQTLEESLKEPGEHCIYIHDIVEAYNMLSMKIQNCNLETTQDTTLRVPPPLLQLSEDESTTIFSCLMRDIGKALPNLFETQPPRDDSLTDLPSIVIDEEDFQQMIEDSLVCQYALSLASDILIQPELHCNFTEDQFASVFHYILSICTAQDSTSFNTEKHVASALFIVKVQRLPLSILTPMKDSIVSALQTSLSEKAGGKYGKIDALKVIPVFLREHPTCVPWFKLLVPIILDHLQSENPEISLNSAWALASFAYTKMSLSSAPQSPDFQITSAIKSYLKKQTSKKLPSSSANSFHSFFKTAIQNDPKWEGLGPSFALTVVATLVVLLDHTLFSIPECLKPVILLLQECGILKSHVVRSGLREVWKSVFWAFSRIPASSDISNDKTKSTKERAFRVVSQHLRSDRRLDLLDFLLRPDGVKNRSENDVDRAIRLVAQLFVKGESMASRLEGVSILSRMVASIGSPSIAPSHREPDELPFAHEILDGSFLLKGTADFNHIPANVLLESFPPLTETEVLRHWDTICETWVLLVQRVLDSADELSSPIQQIWQALLLVKSDVQGPGLSSSSLFSSTIISIIQAFSIKLDSGDSQVSYLSCIKKLWSVMKNVFERSWLSSPGEKILAMLLKHQFTLSDDRVKDSWSRLCADLISVGVPDLSRLLHLHDENKEEEELRTHLWTVLAKNDSTKGGLEALVDLLLTPFGAWDLNPEDCESWEALFIQICAIGKDNGQGSGEIVSQFLSRCSEQQLDSLRKSPKILCCLLKLSTESSSSLIPCSQPTLKILSWIDDILSRAYGIPADKSWAVDSLRLIGKVISKTGQSDIVKLLCVIQQSLTLWIGDEQHQLDEQEDEELVDALYTKSLDKLAHVEPAISILHDLETFLHSVFLRIRGQGPLVFLNFWRATYHTRRDLPKNEYPPLIRQCLKAWSDVTANSFGDGFSLDSGSQSLQSYTIPDSQLENADVDQMEFNLDPFVNQDTALLITAHDYSADSHSRRSATPTAERRLIPAEGTFTSHIYDGHHVDDASKMISLGSVASSSKRRAESDPPRTPKRLRMEGSQIIDTPQRKNKGKAKAEDFKDSMESYANSASDDSPSRPLDRVPSKRSKTSSQLLRSLPQKKRKRSISPVPMPAIASRPTPSGSGIRQSPQPNMHTALQVEDYDSWEQPMPVKEPKPARAKRRRHISSDIVPDSEELRQAEQEREREAEKRDLIIPDSEELRIAEAARAAEEGDEEGEQTDRLESDDHDILSPLLGEYPFRSRVRERSQTAPEFEHPQTFSPPTASRSLRRNRTTQDEIKHNKTPSAQLDILQRAYAVVADTGGSDVDVNDIMEAKRLLNQINMVLDEQMLKVGSSGRREEDKNIDTADLA